MSPAQATVEVFWTAFKALPKNAQEGVLARLMGDRGIREDLVDIALIEKRRSEKTRPFAAYLSQHRARK
ncbi:MAG: hypothetical protein ACHQ51_07175 [Elusimicrobiota bacterium]